MARYVDEGAEVLVVTCTGGERGASSIPRLQGRPDIEANMANIRKAEMDRARAILGVKQAWLGYVDSGLPEGDPPPPLPDGCFGLVPVEEGAERLVKVMRAFRPHVVDDVLTRTAVTRIPTTSCATKSLSLRSRRRRIQRPTRMPVTRGSR